MTSGRLALTIGLVAALGVGAVFLLSEGTSSFTLDEQVRSLDVGTDAGDLRVEVGGELGVTRSSTRGARVDERVEGGAVRLAASCPALLGPTCRASYETTVSAGAVVRLATGDGDIRVSGPLTGSLRAAAGGGSVDLEGVRGPITVRMAGGSVSGRELGSRAVDVMAGAGDVELSLTGPNVQIVTVETTSGAVEILVPDGRYRVDADTTGEVDIGVTVDEQSNSVITVRSASGDVTVRPLDQPADGQAP